MNTFLTMARQICLLFILLFYYSLPFRAQKVKTTVEQGEATYYVENDETINQGKQKAEQMAKQNAINKAFPGEINAVNTMMNESENSVNGIINSSSSFHSTSFMRLSGEWIGNKQDPRFELFIDQNLQQLVISCSVKGTIRKVEGNQPSIQWKILKNNPESNEDAVTFYDGDYIYLSFRAPCDGYIAVLLLNGQQEVECWIPNADEPNGIYSVKANQEYIFFSDNHPANEDMMKLPPRQLTPDNGEVEHCSIHLFFSKKQFQQPLSNKPKQHVVYDGSEYELPPVLPASDFNLWMAKQLANDGEMVHEYSNIVITKK